MRQFTTIKGRFSEARELPRIGKIKLGLKVQGARGTYPTETEYFVCPPEVCEAYNNETPIELDVLLPSNNKEDVLRSKYAMYGSGSGLKCHGDGVDAERYNERTNAWEPRTCPCEFLKSDENPKGTCTPKTDLMVMLPLVSMGGVYQIKTGSEVATKNLNSSIEFIQHLTGGRIAFLPMKLRRVPREMTHNGHKRTHYIMTLTLNATWQETLQFRQNPDTLLIPEQYRIATPLDENPELDAVDVVVDAETVADAKDEAELMQIQTRLREKQEKQTDTKSTPQQTSGSSASTQPGQADADGTDVKSEAPKETVKNGNGHMTPQKWQEIVKAIANDEEWCYYRNMWQHEHKVDQVDRMTPAGQRALLDYIKSAVGPAFPY